MKYPNLASKDRLGHDISDSLQRDLKNISKRCVNCKLCQKECEFLKNYGKPKEIADFYDPLDKTHLSMPFECSLCGLCATVCPVNIDPAEMFLEMRRETVRRGCGEFPEHSGILGHEKHGTSRRYTYYTLPPNCDTIFFPGCTLAGTRPDKTMKLYEHIRETIPTLGMVLDCCTKPSHDIGREEYFDAMFNEMKDFLVTNGVRSVLVACPNCYKVFSKYGGKLSVKTVYEVMAQSVLPKTKQITGTVTIHDPCPVRHERSIHSAIRELVKQKGLTIEEMPHNGEKTLCCGEGGSVGSVSPGLSKKWGDIRKHETDGRRMITYCAGCSNFLGTLIPTDHILDLVFEPEATLTGKVGVSKAPFTYLNRLRLKKRFKKSVNGSVTRERAFIWYQEKKKRES
jgi:Fe-S oxidoreductase